MPYAFYLHDGDDGHIHAYGNGREFDQFWGGNESGNVLVDNRKNMDWMDRTHTQYEVDNCFLPTILVSKEWVHSQST